VAESLGVFRGEGGLLRPMPVRYSLEDIAEDEKGGVKKVYLLASAFR